jgi:H+/Na+-translocating ferredoxin:NAD+ oxidoreductase subunit G
MEANTMADSVIRHALGTAGIMIGFTVVGTVLLASTFFTTRAPIAKSEAAARMQLFRQILPESLHDNDLLSDTTRIPAGGELHNRGDTLAYRARLHGDPAAVILETLAPDGYSGDIKLLVAIRADGELVGVRVIAHKETPGLGDYIDIAHGNWIKNFDGQSLAKMSEGVWKVKKDGGSFDYMAGATITPRAVVKAVHGALKYFAAHRDELFAAQAKEAGYE